jgi:hypothetical protein
VKTLRSFSPIRKIRIVPVPGLNAERRGASKRPVLHHLTPILYQHHLWSLWQIKFWGKWLPKSNYFVPFKRCQNIHTAISENRILKQCRRLTLRVGSFAQEIGQCKCLVHPLDLRSMSLSFLPRKVESKRDNMVVPLLFYPVLRPSLYTWGYRSLALISVLA